MPSVRDPAPNLLHWPRPQHATVFLDFDGTLVDIADTPSGISIPEDLPSLLHLIWTRTKGEVYLVSGRAVEDVASHLPSFVGDIYGGHGAQRRVKGNVSNHALAGSARVTRYQDAVRGFVAEHAGTLAEMKEAGVVLHYRKAPDLADKAEAFVTDLVADDPEMIAHPAKMAFELKPENVDKGSVVTSLLKTAKTPIFCGDDTTDEAGFAAVHRAGGISVKVGDGDTHARTRLSHPAALRSLLWQWLREDLG